MTQPAPWPGCSPPAILRLGLILALTALAMLFWTKAVWPQRFLWPQVSGELIYDAIRIIDPRHTPSQSQLLPITGLLVSVLDSWACYRRGKPSGLNQLGRAQAEIQP
jgi:hypothetical protein